MNEFDRRKEEIRKSRIETEKNKYNEDFIEECYKQLIKEQGIIMLPFTYQQTGNNILEMLEGRENMVKFVVQLNGDKYIVLRYKPINRETIDVKDVFAQANEAFKSKDYHKSVELYSNLFNVFSKPSSFIYSRIGLSLLKIGKKRQAVPYLQMATAMAKKEEKDIDYTDLVESIRNGVVDEEERKANVVMDDSDFDYYSSDNYYGINNFDAINDYILLTGVDVETACLKFGLSKEDTDIVKLLYAREFFTRKEMKKGEQFLKSYEESENKTGKSKELHYEIVRKKKIYANGREESSKKLLLSLQPKTKKKDN